MGPEAFADQFDVSRETLTRLMAYQALLGRWQQRINLVGPATLDAFWHRHAADSAQILALAGDKGGVWLDLGSGGGFPGLIVALLLQPHDGHVHLVESDGRKAVFLQTVIREVGAPATVHNQRAEALAAAAPDFLVDVNVISARALAPLPELLGLIFPFFNSSTVALLHKGASWQDELTQAQQSWMIGVEAHASQTHDASRILQINHLARRKGGVLEY
ncbi:MAG: 16S rRNA (guanine(527)-N(7))-methyltransferase RsmG [Rhizobiales bacterium TMED143]|nr:16S rRNA (guanine(527)-N(7))-methyltransferase RsmG [Rhodobiaceae bacterium]OUV92662.1 MAG: 16S rRNA (guanine(527)-N(7))-methyltransferase RsmG [Rhizobiales bacterium TMED143]CAI8407764.1 MAG: Ribosomal RNA small subunit methyltransferase G [Rhodobiaceae bacterium UBA7378]HCQ81895.1 16S rRNA (guanine(527)-N(7))-methyltransferase RsmG [Rhodobiaceae bacterium]|tara:strand:- start:419 stop:1072 length:654 start_codon:yes stop_codon:yes gene_type:complete